MKDGFDTMDENNSSKEKNTRFLDNSSDFPERIYILQPITESNEHTYESLIEEAKALIESAGAAVAGVSTQKLREISPATVFGMGKLAEIAEILSGLDVTVLYNGDLTPSQTRNISAALGDRKVIERTTLILDIFARNAVTAEGKLQVELAQLKYVYPRLKGKGTSLSRQGGGVGTRGPGETRLETDRRYIRNRIDYLEKRLSELESRRKLQTQRRKKTQVKTIALVGYTNAGKSTLFNRLCDENVYAQDRLFATLDATSRRFCVRGIEFFLVDTVGFLRDLPHDLIEAFKSTLESALNCDLALLVCDAASEFQMQIDTTTSVLKSMNFSSPYLVVANKCDRLSRAEFDALNGEYVGISAKTGDGIDVLKEKIYDCFADKYANVRLRVPYTQIKAYSAKKKLLSEEKIAYRDDCMEVFCTVEKTYLDEFCSWISAKEE